VVRHTLALLDGHLVREDGQAIVQLHGVAVDDLAIEALGKLNS
jgi:hypothetical protein